MTVEQAGIGDLIYCPHKLTGIVIDDVISVLEFVNFFQNS